MDLFRLASRNIGGSAFRSWIIALCAALVAGLVISATMIIGGAQSSLRHINERLGADIMVIPSGNQVRLEQALLMGIPATLWMPASVVTQTIAIPGVYDASPQLFLSTMRGASCCSVSDMFMIAYDPATDFSVRPWLERNLEGDLGLGEAVGGRYVTVPAGRTNILIYGYEIDLVGRLEPTGSGLDQSMFFTFETALDIARLSPMQAERQLVIAPDSISAALVRLDAGADPGQMASEIEKSIPGVAAIEATGMFRAQRNQTLGLLRIASALVSSAWVLSIALVGLVTSMAAVERRREVGVLRALGAQRPKVLLVLMMEGGVLALAGGAAGTALAASSIALFRNLIVRLTGVPFLFPSPLAMLALTLGVLTLTLISVNLAMLFPIWRIARLEPGTALKEW